MASNPATSTASGSNPVIDTCPKRNRTTASAAQSAHVTGMITILAVPRPEIVRRNAVNSAVRSALSCSEVSWGISTGTVLAFPGTERHGDSVNQCAESTFTDPGLVKRVLRPTEILVECRDTP